MDCEAAVTTETGEGKIQLDAEQRQALIDSIQVHGLLRKAGHLQMLFSCLHSGMELLPEEQLQDCICRVLQVDSLEPYYAPTAKKRFDVSKFLRRQRTEGKMRFPDLPSEARKRLTLGSHLDVWPELSKAAVRRRIYYETFWASRDVIAAAACRLQKYQEKHAQEKETSSMKSFQNRQRQIEMIHEGVRTPHSTSQIGDTERGSSGTPPAGRIKVTGSEWRRFLEERDRTLFTSPQVVQPLPPQQPQRAAAHEEPYRSLRPEEIDWSAFNLVQGLWVKRKLALGGERVLIPEFFFEKHQWRERQQAPGV